MTERRILEMQAIAQACRSVIEAGPEDGLAPREVIRAARDVAEAVAEVLQWLDLVPTVDQKRRTLAALDAAHVRDFLEPVLDGVGIRVERSTGAVDAAGAVQP